MLHLMLFAMLSGATIQGTVRGEGERAPIPGARASLVALNQTKLSDSVGTFMFADVPAGQWRLTVSASGFLPYETVVRVSERGTLRLDVELAPAASALPRVDVRADRDPEDDARAARDLFGREPMPSVTVMSSREVRGLPTPIEPDVMKALQMLPGVVPANDFDAQLYVRGGAGDQNLVLLDGARVFGPYHMFGMTGAFNPDAVGGATFFRGMLPARYGGALSSVVAIEQREGTPQQPIEGGLNFLGARVAAGGTLFADRGRWMVAGRRSHADLFVGDRVPYAFHDLTARVSFTPSPSQQVSGSVFRSSDRFRMFLAGGDESLMSEWGNTVGSLRWRRTDADGDATSATAWASQYDGMMTAGSRVAGATTQDDVVAGGLRVERMWQRARSQLRLGGELEFARITLAGSDLPGNYFSGHARSSYVAPSIYAEAEHRLGAVGLFPGLRLTRDVRSGRLLAEPRLSARLALPDSMTLTLAATRGYQAVSMLRDERTVLPGPAFWFVHPSEAPTSRSDGLSAELDIPLSRVWSIRTEAYGRRFSGLPHWRPEGARDLASVSYDAGTAAGFEVSVRRYGERLSGWVGYGTGRTHLEESATGDSYFPSWDRRHAFTAALMAQLTRRLTLSARVDYGSGQPFWPFAGTLRTARFAPYVGGADVTASTVFWSRDQVRFPSYFRTDLGLRTTFDAWGATIEPYLSLQNVTARRNVLYYELKVHHPEYSDGAGEKSPPTLKAVSMPVSFFPTIGFNVRF